jgi:WD40 repeat protein
VLDPPAAHAAPAANPPRRVNALRFSPDGQYLAVACADAILLCDAPSGYAQVARCAGHSSAVTHLDWTTTSDMLRSNDAGHELRFWSAPSGERITHASLVRDMPWATASVTLGWHCQGIFRNRADGTGVHSVDRSADDRLLVTADELGQVNLFRNPCVRAAAKPDEPNKRSFAAHASAALACRWADDGEGDCVVSAGGYDVALMQWRRRRGGAP